MDTISYCCFVRIEPEYTITSTAKDSVVIEQDAKYTEVY